MTFCKFKQVEKASNLGSKGRWSPRDKYTDANQCPRRSPLQILLLISNSPNIDLKQGLILLAPSVVFMDRHSYVCFLCYHETRNSPSYVVNRIESET